MNDTPIAIHVFRAGRHTTSAGEDIEFSQADLKAVASRYDPALHQAPLVIGHPKTDDPAYGWVKGFEVHGDDLYAIAEQVLPAFAELINSGAYKQRSMAWYRPNDAANPAPGHWYPRHIGFLGAQPPAIKGLKPVQFREGGAPVEIVFSEWTDRSVLRLLRSLRDWLLARHGQEEADRALPAHELEHLSEGMAAEKAEKAAEMARATDAPAPAPLFAEPAAPASAPVESQPTYSKETTVSPEEVAALKAENQRLKEENAYLIAAQERAARQALRAEAVQFCEALIQDGRLMPAHKDTVIALYELTARTAPVEFGEGEGKTTELLLDRFKAMLAAGPRLVEFAEIAGGRAMSDGELDPAALAARAVEYMEAEARAGRQINIAQAVAHVQAEG